MYNILISWNSPTVKMFGSAPLMFKPTNESASVRGNLATTLQRSFIFKRIVREWVHSTSNECSYVNDTKGRGQRWGQRSEVKGPAEVINVMNTPESEGRGHSEEHSGLPPSASPSRVLPSRLINYWESQPESSVCVFASRLLPLHTCVVATTTPSIELERGVFDQEDRSTQALLFRLYSNRRLLVCLCWCFTSLIHTLILNLTELIYFVSSDVVLCLRLLLSLTPAFLFSHRESRSRAAAIVRQSTSWSGPKELQTNHFQSL